MKLVLPPSNSEALPHDDFDTLLRSYFQSEMPHPWPVLPPSRVVLKESQTWLMRESTRSRLALAASVALLICGAFVLPGRLPVAEKSDRQMSSGEATRLPHVPDIKKFDEEIFQRPDGSMGIRYNVSGQNK